MSEAQALGSFVFTAFGLLILFIINIFYLRWVFKVNTMANCQQMQVALLVKLVQKSGVTDLEIADALAPAVGKQMAIGVVNKVNSGIVSKTK